MLTTPKLKQQEPRGYPCQNLNILFPSEMPGVDWGFVTCEQNSIYPLFSGHNTMCVVTALLVSIESWNTRPHNFVRAKIKQAMITFQGMALYLNNETLLFCVFPPFPPTNDKIFCATSYDAVSRILKMF